MLKSTVLLNKNIIKKCVRFLSTTAEPNLKNNNRIKAWQIHSYEEEVQFCSIRPPFISSPNDVLVKIEAASINPLDVLMKDGYGRSLIKLFRLNEDIILPITLGRDFSGKIIDKGCDVKEFNIDDKVYGVVPFYKQGTHAEYTIADKDHIIKKPDSVTHTEAASIPYTALTAYSALWYTGGLFWRNPKGMKILILGASGGVGICAVQMLKAVGANVFATCSKDAVPLLQKLGINNVYDYRDSNYVKNVASQGSYDIILDCAKIGHETIPASWEYSSYISLNSPLLKNTDDYGLLGGLAYSAADLIPSNLLKISQGKCIKWAYFYPSNYGLQFINKLVKNDELIPVIHQVYEFEKLPEAYEKIKEGHLRGKLVIDMLKSKSNES